jgi:predicted small secreted protein
MRPTILHVLLLAIALVVLAMCNTIRGVGKDIEKAGEVIQDTADKSPRGPASRAADGGAAAATAGLSRPRSR